MYAPPFVEQLEIHGILEQVSSIRDPVAGHPGPEASAERFSQKISCPLEGPPFLNELGDVGMDDAVPLLNGIASRQQVLGIVIFNLLERAVFALLGGPVGHDGHCDLNVCIAHLWVPQDEIALQLSDASHTDLATLRESVAINDVLEDGPVVDAVVGVEGEVEAQIRQVVLLLTPQRFSRLQVEASALADNLRVFEDLKVSRERLALDLHALLTLKVGLDVRKRRGGAEVVDDVVAHLVEHGDVLDLHAPADVLFEDLLDYRHDVSALVGESGVIHCFREAALEDVGIKFHDRVRVHGQSQEALHLAILVKV